MSRALSAVYTVISIQHYGEVLQCGPFCLLEYSHQVVREAEGQFIETFFAYDWRQHQRRSASVVLGPKLCLIYNPKSSFSSSRAPIRTKIPQRMTSSESFSTFPIMRAGSRRGKEYFCWNITALLIVDTIMSSQGGRYFPHVKAWSIV